MSLTETIRLSIPRRRKTGWVGIAAISMLTISQCARPVERKALDSQPSSNLSPEKLQKPVIHRRLITSAPAPGIPTAGEIAADCKHPKESKESTFESQDGETMAVVILKPSEIRNLSPVLRGKLLRVLLDGMQASRDWVKVSSENLANIDTTRTAGGVPYRRKTVRFQTVQLCLPGRSVDFLTAVHVVDDITAFPRRFQPDHPDALEDGYVRYPNVDQEREIANITAAANGYIASLENIRIIDPNALIDLQSQLAPPPQ